MSLRIAVQMDLLEQINVRSNSTFALMLEAHRRQYSLFHYLPSSLAMLNDCVFAFGRDIELRPAGNGDCSFSVGDHRQQYLSEMDVILLRQDPPFDMGYITSTYLLEYIYPKVLTVNDPVHVRNFPEKLFVTSFPDLIPPTLVTRDLDAIRDFRTEHEDIVLKPLYGNGGSGVLRIKPDDGNMSSLLDLFGQLFCGAFVIQKYLPEVRQGDKRIILVDGEFSGIFNRVPSAGEIRSNMCLGGRPEAISPSVRDLEICAKIGPVLHARGMIFAGIDVIGDYLTEINVTSPCGIQEISGFGGPDIAALIWDAIESKL